MRGSNSFLVVFALTFSSTTLFSQLQSGVDDKWNFPEARQFDFWIGEWDVNLRMIQEDLSWEDRVKSKAKIFRILDGKAILEFWDSEAIKGYSLRHYDPEQEKWILYLNWPSKNRSGTSSLQGSFRHSRGEFFSTRKNQQGEEVLSRFTFSDITPQSLRWDDAFSTDGGKTWTNNWIMEFSRREDVPVWPEPGGIAHTYESGARCDLEEFREFEMLQGHWNGVLNLSGGDEWIETQAELRGWKVLDGCAVMNLFSYKHKGNTHQTFSIKTYNTYANVFEDTRLDDKRGTGVKLYYGSKTDKGIELVESDPGSSTQLLSKYIWNIHDTNEIDLDILVSHDNKITWTRSGFATFTKTQ